jgi:pyridoxal phosphate enzyme (YggS family)
MIEENIRRIKSQIPENVTLVAVSKTKPAADILTAYNAGHRDFGENKVQELVDKHEQLPKEIQWHLIGHLQTNKVKYIAPFVHLIHAIDSFKLLKEVNKQAVKCNRIIDCLLQFHIAEEENKFGFDYDEVISILESDEIKSLKNINITGVMGMATFTQDNEQIKREFRTLKRYFTQLQSTYFKGKNDFTIVSMGMSGDYRLAIEEGSTMIRVGSSIFGNR